MTDHDELIARLEAATEGSVPLDVDIARALGWTCLAEHQDNDVCRFAVKNAHDTGNWRGINWDDHGAPRGDCTNWPFSTSMDAALTLVPEEWSWMLQSPGNYSQMWRGGLAGPPFVEANGTSVALSICIAALKARRVS